MLRIQEFARIDKAVSVHFVHVGKGQKLVLCHSCPSHALRESCIRFGVTVAYIG